MNKIRKILQNSSFQQIFMAFILALGASLLIIEPVSPTPNIEVGDIAQRDIQAPRSFQYSDPEHKQKLRKEAVARVRPVYTLLGITAEQEQIQIKKSFQQARDLAKNFPTSETQPSSQKNTPSKRTPAPDTKTTDDSSASIEDDNDKNSNNDTGSEIIISKDQMMALQKIFSENLNIYLTTTDIVEMLQIDFSKELEESTLQLYERAMSLYITNEQVLPSDVGYTVITLYSSRQKEVEEDDWSLILTPEKARKQISLYASSLQLETQTQNAALQLTKALLKANFSYNLLETETRKREARDQISEEFLFVKRGTILVRQGDIITKENQGKLQQAFAKDSQSFNLISGISSLLIFVAVVIFSIYAYAAGFIRRFSSKKQDVIAISILALLVLILGRLTVEGSLVVSETIQMGMSPTAFWYITPFAAGAMLVRILVNSETALIWIVGTALLMALIMDQQALMSIYFIISGVIASSSISNKRERVEILKAGLQTGLVNGALALLIKLCLLYISMSNLVIDSSKQPLWDVGMAFGGGILSSFLVLGLIPIFELFNFVTDFKMLELANLNHPLLRQLMLNAPGTYHHSMTMALLSEAAAEKIGANGLQTRIACYYHDIGKSLQPHYFIENQRNNYNPHDRLTPKQSARIIKTHVVDGVALGEQYNLPEPVMNAIWMHHGTSLIKYFYVQAKNDAEDPDQVKEADYQYAGKKPNTREAGIIFLADRIEAACRTLKDPTMVDFRQKIQELVNSAVAEGQLMECPLTLQEIYTIIDSFTETLVGIHHHRIEYPKMNNADQQEDTGPIITLEGPNPLNTPESTDPNQSSDGNLTAK